MKILCACLYSVVTSTICCHFRMRIHISCWMFLTSVITCCICRIGGLCVHFCVKLLRVASEASRCLYIVVFPVTVRRAKSFTPNWLWPGVCMKSVIVQTIFCRRRSFSILTGLIELLLWICTSLILSLLYVSLFKLVELSLCHRWPVGCLYVPVRSYWRRFG